MTIPFRYHQVEQAVETLRQGALLLGGPNQDKLTKEDLRPLAEKFSTLMLAGVQGSRPDATLKDALSAFQEQYLPTIPFNGRVAFAVYSGILLLDD